jgi:hypothetical protein
MSESTKNETFIQWLVGNIIIYVIPFCITVYIVVNEYWPYKPLRQIIKGQRSGKYGDNAQDIINTGVALIVFAVFYGLAYFFKKLTKRFFG